MKRFGAGLLLCALSGVAAGGYEPPYQTHFLIGASLRDVVDGRLPDRLQDHHGIYPLLVWLRLSGRYTAQHQALLEAYLNDRGRKYPEEYEYKNEWVIFIEELEADGYVVGELKRHRLVERFDERAGERIVTSSWIDNCRPDAFRTAHVTYVHRRARYGAGSVALDRWVEAQLAVFRQCDGDEGDTPGEPDPRWQPLERQDRLYQIAAWHFYRQSYLEAAQRFGSIAESEDSPWQALARYLVPRSLARQAVVHETDSWEDFTAVPIRNRRHLLQQALNGFESLAADEAYLAEFPSVMTQMMHIRVALDESTFHGNFERRLIEQPSSVDPSLIYDYDYLAARWDEATGRPDAYGRWLRHAVESDVDDLVEAARAERTLPYLYLALGYAHENIAPADLRDLLVQSRHQTPETPGYLAMLGHRLRVAEMLGDHAAMAELKGELAEQLTRVSSTAEANRLRLQIATRASDWREYLHWSSLRPLGLPWPDAHARSMPTELFHRITRDSPLFPRAAASVINIFATPSAILDMLDATGLSDYQRSRLANAGWVRALLADNLATAAELAPHVGQFSPLLAEEMEGFTAAEDKQFEAAWIVLRHPGLSPWLPSGVGRIEWESKVPPPDRFAVSRDEFNWWCGTRAYTTHRLTEGLPYFLRDTGMDKQYRIEFPTAAEFFGPHVIRYARENRGDPRIPQALHRVIFATRYSCSSGPGDVSQNAHAILHRDYADSEWVEKTPYWYD